MSDEELKILQQQVKKAKRIATERAGELHDLVEDGLPAAYRDLPAVSQACYDACVAWAEVSARLAAAEAQIQTTV